MWRDNWITALNNARIDRWSCPDGGVDLVENNASQLPF
ncbi:hypothetical protein MGWOODY_XGa327 [hydrothermal vent metagenome]|uniref:Uncharacterized protein n=1 Tax=hydrothermal vent metagenome TaxID=652676 RepID=A0A160TSH7_9ZZZZ